MKRIDVKKLILPNIPYVFIALLATKVSEAVRLAPGSDASTKLLNILTGLNTAFQSLVPSFHPIDLCVGIAAAIAIRLAVYIKGKNAKKFRKNLEYGSARWGTAEDIKPYVDPAFENNIILTQTESLTMNSRPKDPKTARNKNVLIVGGSGSGKTRFWLKPNLLQCTSQTYPTSFVVTDPKGDIVVSCGHVLQKNGYQVKILNSLNFKKSMHYNPFAYIHSEKDILKLVTTLIANTKGEGKAGDDFWVKAETLLYSRDMSIKTKSAKYAKMQRGEYQSKICPYGYRKSADGRMEPDPEAAAVVQLIFRLAAEGVNATAITRELFRRSIPTPGQYKAARGNHTHDISRCHGIWSASTILRILEDERYTGVYVIGKRAVLEVGGTRSRLKDRESWYIIPNHHPAIVEKAAFDTVQASQLRFSQPNKKKRDYPLKGKAFCGCCGHALSRTMQKTSYYYCRHSEADEESRCHKMRLNAAELEQAVFLTLKKQMEAAAPIAPDGTLRVDVSVPERAEYEQQIEALQDSKRTLYERYLMGEIDLNTYKAEKAACDELLLKTKNAYAAALAQAKQKQDEQARQNSRKEASKAIFDADTLTTELAELLIDRVLVYPDKRIEIAYKIRDIFD